MTIYEFEGRIPSIDPTAYVDEDAGVVGEMTIARSVNRSNGGSWLVSG